MEVDSLNASSTNSYGSRPLPDLHDRFDTVNGLRTHSIVGGTGRPVVLLHGDGESAFDWSWVLPHLAREYQVFAPDLPGCGASAKPEVQYSPGFYGAFLRDYLSTLDLRGVALVGNSLGGLVALTLALDDPSRVGALVLVDSAGLGRAVSPALVAQGLPGTGEFITFWGRTSMGSAQLARSRACLLFANPWEAPGAWLQEQERLAQTPGFLPATISAIRNDLCFGTQRVVKLDDLPPLSVPLKVIWGQNDLVVPFYQAYLASEKAGQGLPTVIANAGHLPHVERPRAFLAALSPFLQAHISSRSVSG